MVFRNKRKAAGNIPKRSERFSLQVTNQSSEVNLSSKDIQEGCLAMSLLGLLQNVHVTFALRPLSAAHKLGSCPPTRNSAFQSH